MHLELPDNRPPGEWQLRIRFPIGCSLQEIDVSLKELVGFFILLFGRVIGLTFLYLPYKLQGRHLMQACTV